MGVLVALLCAQPQALAVPRVRLLEVDPKGKVLWSLLDPGFEHSVAVSYSMVGYAYNSKYVDKNDPRFPHWDLLFESKDYAGRLTMLDDMYITIGCALKYLDFSYNSDDEDELMMAKQVLLRQKPWLLAYDAWPVRQVLGEEAWAAQSWIGDTWVYHQDLKAIEGALPPEGTVMGIDQMVIPIGGPHPATAHLFMNYVFRPDVQALLIEKVGLVHSLLPTALGADPKKVIESLPEKIEGWGIAFSKEFLDRCEFVEPKSYTGKGLELRMKIWEELKK